MFKETEMNITGGLTLERLSATSTKVTATSTLSGNLNTLELHVSQERIVVWLQGGTLIQDAFPELNAQQREFMLTGTTQDEWDDVFGIGDEEGEE
jgi:hypothetical protein